MRKVKPAIELASDIGVKAFDLHRDHDDVAVRQAFAFLVTVNPELFSWLRDRLLEAVPNTAADA